MTGLDPGFFVKLLKGDRQAITLFEEMDENADLCVSCLTIFELKRLALRGALGKDAVNKLIDNILSLCRISWLDTKIESTTAFRPLFLWSCRTRSGIQGI